MNLGLLLVDIVLKATVILCVAWLATFVFRRAAAATRHMIWVLSLAALLVLPAFEALAPRWTVVHLSSPKPVAVASTVPLSKVETEELTTGPVSDSSSGLVETSDSDRFAETSVVANPVISPTPRANDYRWAILVWGLGSFVVGSVIAAGFLTLRRIESRAVSLPDALAARLDGQPITIRRSLEGRPPTAMTWGAIRPTIMLPQGAEEWSEDRLETVLLHELAHVRRWDAATQVLGMVVCALYWFHPAVWMAAKAARAMAESATDDAVLNAGVRPSTYASTLMEVATELSRQPRPLFSPGVSFMKQSKIESRVRAILDAQVRRVASRWEKMAAAALALAVLSPSTLR